METTTSLAPIIALVFGQAGMIVGAVTVFVWMLVLNPLGGIFELYEILPAFLLNLVVAVVVSLAPSRPNPVIEEEFDAAVAGVSVSR